MYYVIENNKFVQVKVIDGDKKNIALLSLEELKRDYEKLGVKQECITWCEDEIKRFSNRFEVYEDFSFSSMEFINLSQSKKNDNRVVFIIKKNIFIAIILLGLIAAGIIAGIFFSDKYKVSAEDFIINIENSKATDAD